MILSHESCPLTILVFGSPPQKLTMEFPNRQISGGLTSGYDGAIPYHFIRVLINPL